MSSQEYFSHLAKKIYLSPSNKVLDNCLKFYLESLEDINLLKNIDTKDIPIHYLSKEISFSWNEFSSLELKGAVENKHLLEALIKDYAISNTKKPS